MSVLRSWTHFLIELFSCQVLRALRVFYVTVLYQICLLQVLNPNLWFVIRFFCTEKFFILTKCTLSTISQIMLLESYLKKASPLSVQRLSKAPGVAAALQASQHLRRTRRKMPESRSKKTKAQWTNLGAKPKRSGPKAKSGTISVTWSCVTNQNVTNSIRKFPTLSLSL